MTVTEREEEGNSFNTKIVEIKKKPVEFELQQQEQEDIDALLNELLKSAYFYDDQLQREIEEEEDAEESERSTKRIRTAESDEAESSSIKNTANLEAYLSELGMDPLELIEEIVLKYLDFIEEIYQMLKDGEKEERKDEPEEEPKDEEEDEQVDEQKDEEEDEQEDVQEDEQEDEQTDEQKDEQKDEQTDEHKKVKIQWLKWRDILDRGNLLVEALNRSLKTVAIEMERMKSVDALHREYSIRKTHVPDLLALLRDINERIESSPNFKSVSDMEKRDKVLIMCLYELETSKEELAEMVEVIQELKELDVENDEAVEDDEAIEDGEEEEIGIEEFEKFNEELDEILKEMGIEFDEETDE